MNINMFQVYFSTDDKLSEWEAVSKGYRSDVYVLCNGLTYKVNIYTPTRLMQDYETEFEYYGYYIIEENTVIVPEASKENIISSLQRLYNKSEFNKMNSLCGDCPDSLIKIY